MVGRTISLSTAAQEEIWEYNAVKMSLWEMKLGNLMKTIWKGKR